MTYGLLMRRLLPLATCISSSIEQYSYQQVTMSVWACAVPEGSLQCSAESAAKICCLSCRCSGKPNVCLRGDGKPSRTSLVSSRAGRPGQHGQPPAKSGAGHAGQPEPGSALSGQSVPHIHWQHGSSISVESRLILARPRLPTHRCPAEMPPSTAAWPQQLLSPGIDYA